jgi:glutaredoxin
MTKLTLYTKPDCCLCEDALALLEQVRAETPFELEIVNVADDGRLLDELGERIPVVSVDGVEAFEYTVDEAELRLILNGTTVARAAES